MIAFVVVCVYVAGFVLTARHVGREVASVRRAKNGWLELIEKYPESDRLDHYREEARKEAFQIERAYMSERAETETWCAVKSYFWPFKWSAWLLANAAQFMVRLPSMLAPKSKSRSSVGDTRGSYRGEFVPT